MPTWERCDRWRGRMDCVPARNAGSATAVFDRAVRTLARQPAGAGRDRGWLSLPRGSVAGRIMAFDERWLVSGRRRSRTRCTPTDAFSNTVSWWNERSARGRGRWGVGPSAGRDIELGVSLRGRCPCRRAYDIVTERYQNGRPDGQTQSRGLRVQALGQRSEELDVGLGLREAVEQDLDALVGARPRTASGASSRPS